MLHQEFRPSRYRKHRFDFLGVPCQLEGYAFKADDVDITIRSISANHFVTLAKEASTYKQKLKKNRYCHLPIEDFQSPTIEQYQQFLKFLHQHKKIALCCGSGCGRTGNMLIAALVAGQFDKHNSQGSSPQKIKAKSSKDKADTNPILGKVTRYIVCGTTKPEQDLACPSEKIFNAWRAVKSEMGENDFPIERESQLKSLFLLESYLNTMGVTAFLEADFSCKTLAISTSKKSPAG